jgi:hypothetical protein
MPPSDSIRTREHNGLTPRVIMGSGCRFHDDIVGQKTEMIGRLPIVTE